MKKNLLFSMLAVFLAGFGFGGVSMADDCTDSDVAKVGVTCYSNITDAIKGITEGNDVVELLKDIESKLYLGGNNTNKLETLKIKKNGFSVIVKPNPAYSFLNESVSEDVTTYKLVKCTSDDVAGLGEVCYSDFNSAASARSSDDDIVWLLKAANYTLNDVSAKLKINKKSGSLLVNPPEGNYYVEDSTDDLGIITYLVKEIPSGAVASIGSNTYTDFASAVTAAGTTNTITLLSDVEYTIETATTIKINKNGHNVNFIISDGYLLGVTTSNGISTYKTYSSSEYLVEVKYGDGNIKYVKNLNSLSDNGAIYKLLSDITTSTRITLTVLVSDVTIDLNGYVITSNASNEGILLSRDGSESARKTFAIIDTSEEKGGKLIVNNPANAAILCQGKYNDITIGEGVTVEGGAVTVLSENQTLTVDGTIKGGNDFAIATNGSLSKNVIINVNEGAIITSDITAIYLPGKEGLVANIAGTVTSKTTGIEIRAGELNIGANAVIKSTYEGEDVSVTANGNGTTTVGAAVAVAQHTTKLPITVNINGGTLEGPAAIYQSNPQNNELSENSKVKTTIADGVIKGDVINTVESDEGKYELAINGGSYSKKTDSNYVLPEHKYLAEQKDGTYQLADQTAISDIKINVTAPVKNGTPITPTTDTDGINFTADGIKWYKTVDSIDTELSTDEKYAENTAYKLVIPYTVADSHYLADPYTVTPTAGTEDHTTERITISFTDDVAEGYTIKFVNHDGTELKTYTVAVGESPVYDGTTPTKASDSSYTYSFKGWSPAIVAATDNATYTAEFTANSKPSYSGGGGGSSRSSSKTTTADDTKKAEDTTKKEETKSDETKSDETKTDESKAYETKTSEEAKAAADAQALKDGYSQEFIDAYNFARKNNITTKDTIREANMDAPLTRIAMAKMLSQYAINVLGKTPDTTKVVPTFPDVSAQLDADYNNGVTLAYQLGIMGIGIENFRPFAEVTRAEFGTALSRMLFGLADGEGAEWYKTHLDKLMNEKIITNDNPNLKELRGYVMIMLMRSAQ